MLKSLTYLAMFMGFLAALIGFVSRLQESRIFLTSRSWLALAAFCLLAAICFVLLSIDRHLEARS